MLAGGDIEADVLLVVDHDAVGAAVDPALVGIAGDVEAAGADIAAAVLLVPFRRRELGHVDRVALHDIFQDRGGGDVFRRDLLHLRHVVLAELLGQLELAEVGREAQRHVLALAAEEVNEHAAAGQRTRHVLEEHRRRLLVMQNDLGSHADIVLPVETLHRAHLAQFARFFEPFAQIAIGEPRLDVGARAALRPASPAADGV